jgi:hypothetical protein
MESGGYTISPRHDEIEFLAFELWQERGAPHGTPEVDWFQAEDELKKECEHGSEALTAVARKIGSALGSVATLMTDVMVAH